MPAGESDYPTVVESDNSSSTGSDEDDNTVMIDFIGLHPSEEDRDEICQFLGMLFPASKVDLSQLAMEIAKTSNVGAVFKIDPSKEEDEEMEDPLEAFSDNCIFGVVSAFQLTLVIFFQKPSASQVVDFLIAKCNSSKASGSTKKSCIGLLKSCDKLVFLVNERLPTLPAKIAAMALNALLKDLAIFEFDYIVTVTRLVQTEVKSRTKRTRNGSCATSNDESYILPEERQFDLHSELCFEYNLDGGSEGERAVKTEEGKMFNRVVLMEKNEFVAAVNEIVQQYTPDKSGC
ncbi:BCIP domain containing protein [Trichuris trichiura]|uniref:BCIP domain containing protein n=1 Tax=Trichuris trichiura TaxID=36087 RepID=A0A077ZBM9_TRITR|nr:BCIP domain containing protein [Trichuris trichiura]